MFLKNVATEFYNNEVKILGDVANAGKLGPITTAVLQYFGLKPTDIAELTARAVLKKFTPLVGQIDAIVKGSKVADILVDQTKTIKDMMFVPIKADFSVTWGLKIIDLEPSIVKAEDIDTSLKILGTGFGIDERWYWADDEPEVYVKDDGKSAGYEIMLFENVAEDGTSIELDIPGEFLKDAIGPISVQVKHRDNTADAPIKIQIGEGIQIARLKASEGQPGDKVIIEGIGFSAVKAKNKVTFTGKNGTRIEASVTKVDNNKITVLVPDNIITGEVTVEVNNELSNGLVFTVPYIVNITFGDNGNFNDDIFKLVVDNKVMSDGATPQRAIGPISVPLSAGIHTVKLVGIRAEDEIGTYYIKFEGDVLSVTGDALEGRDLLKSQEKSYQIKVGEGQLLRNSINYLNTLQIE